MCPASGVWLHHRIDAQRFQTVSKPKSHNNINFWPFLCFPYRQERYESKISRQEKAIWFFCTLTFTPTKNSFNLTGNSPFHSTIWLYRRPASPEPACCMEAVWFPYWSCILSDARKTPEQPPALDTVRRVF